MPGSVPPPQPRPNGACIGARGKGRRRDPAVPAAEDDSDEGNGRYAPRMTRMPRREPRQVRCPGRPCGGGGGLCSTPSMGNLGLRSGGMRAAQVLFLRARQWLGSEAWPVSAAVRSRSPPAQYLALTVNSPLAFARVGEIGKAHSDWLEFLGTG
jgi:hypothetical protein